jgi:hypothetical protein
LRGVAQLANCATPAINGSPIRSLLRLVWPACIAFGVGHELKVTSTLKSFPRGCANCFSKTSGVQLALLKSRVFGDAQAACNTSRVKL